MERQTNRQTKREYRQQTDYRYKTENTERKKERRQREKIERKGGYIEIVSKTQMEIISLDNKIS